MQAQPVSERLTGTKQTELQHIELWQTRPIDPASKDSIVEARNASGCVTTAELPIEVAQDSIIYSKWKEVLIVDNHAGLYTAYQWYQNGQPVGNEQVLHVPAGMSDYGGESMEKAIDFCFRTGGTAGSVVTTQIATGVAFMAPSAIRCDRLAERDLSNFPEVLPYSHRWHTVLSMSITSEYNSDNGSPSRHISTMLGRSPCDFTFSRISTRTNPGAPIETSAAFRMGRSMEKAIDFCFRTGGTAGSVVTTQIATGVAFMTPGVICSAECRTRAAWIFGANGLSVFLIYI